MPAYLVVQISDVHLTGASRLRHGVHPEGNLRRGLQLLERTGIKPDIFLLTGDLTDRGEPACYEALASLVETAAANAGAAVVYLPGNHDDRAGFCRYLLGEPEETVASGPLNRVHWRDGLRIVALDSVVPGEEGGVLAEETLAFLQDVLATPAPDGTIVALHHPPIPSPIAPLTTIMLGEPARLGEAIAGTDVRLVACGHNHHASAGSLAGVPVWVAPASAYLADITSTAEFRGLPGSAFTRIDLDDTGVRTSIIPVPDR